MKHFLLAAFIVLSSSSASAITWNEFWRPFVRNEYYGSPSYQYYQPMCRRTVYREEYVPGTSWNPGYVRTWRHSVVVPCD